MKILRQIRCKACSRWRTPDRFHVQVIAMALFHGKVFEVERTGTKPRARSARRIRWWFSTKTVSKEHRWRLHGSQRGRMFHGCRDRTDWPFVCWTGRRMVVKKKNTKNLRRILPTAVTDYPAGFSFFFFCSSVIFQLRITVEIRFRTSNNASQTKPKPNWLDEVPQTTSMQWALLRNFKPVG